MAHNSVPGPGGWKDRPIDWGSMLAVSVLEGCHAISGHVLVDAALRATGRQPLEHRYHVRDGLWGGHARPLPDHRLQPTVLAVILRRRG